MKYTPHLQSSLFFPHNLVSGTKISYRNEAIIMVSVPRLMIICIIHVLKLRNTGLKQDVLQKEKNEVYLFPSVEYSVF